MIRRFLLLAACLLLAVSTRAQQIQSHVPLSSFGQDFYLAYMPSSLDCAAITPFQSTWIVINAPYDCNVTISYFDQITGQEFTDKTYRVKAKHFVQVPVNLSNTVVHDNTGKNVNIDGEVAEYTSCHVRSDKIITVSYFSTGPDDCAMYMALPVHALGKKYVVAAAPNDDGMGGGIPRGCSGHFPAQWDPKLGIHVT